MRAHGFAMAIVIAVLVVFGILGASLVVISSTQHVGLAMDLQGVKAYHASRAGLEWGIYHVLRTGVGGGCDNINGKVIAFAGNLAGFRAAVACNQTTHPEGTAMVTMSVITVTACNDNACPTGVTPPPVGYAERQLRVTIAQ